MEKIVLASNNSHKVEEIKNILNNVEILTLKDIGFNSDIEENGNTFLENALIKAKEVSKFLKDNGLSYRVLADDSGLCCEALNGEPGIYSARFSKDHDNESNRKKVIECLKGKDKTAYFNCTLVLYNIDDTYIYSEGKTYGKIIDEARGNTSFCYDPIFLSDDLGKTFGEATSEEKNSVSHRYRALLKISEMLNKS